MSTKAEKPWVWFLTVNRGKDKNTADLIRSLRKIDYPNRKISIISEKGKRIPDNGVLHRNSRICFDPACASSKGTLNESLKRALQMGFDYVVYADNRLEISPDWLHNVLQAFQRDDRVAACGPCVLMKNTGGVIFSQGTDIYRNGSIKKRGSGEIIEGAENEECDIASVSEEIFILKTKALEKTGFIEEEHSFGFGMVDLCLRLWEEGYRVAYVPSAVVYMKGGDEVLEKEAGKRIPERISIKDRLGLILRNYPLKELREIAVEIFQEEVTKLDAAARERDSKKSRRKWEELRSTFLSIGALLRYRIRRKGGNGGSKIWRFVKEKLERELETPVSISRSGAVGGDSRILMGIEEEGLGAGWYSLRREGAFCRYLGRQAEITFKGGIKGEYLQLMVSNPFDHLNENRLEIYFNGELAGEIKAARTWGSYIIRLPENACAISPEKPKNNHTLLFVTDFVYPPDISQQPFYAGYRFAEISLLSEDSVFLRRGLNSDGKPMSCVIQAGVEETGMIEGWEGFDRVEMFRWTGRRIKFELKTPRPGVPFRLKMDVGSVRAAGVQRAIVYWGRYSQKIELHKGWNHFEFHCDATYEKTIEAFLEVTDMEAVNPHDNHIRGIKVLRIETADEDFYWECHRRMEYTIDRIRRLPMNGVRVLDVGGGAGNLLKQFGLRNVISLDIGNEPDIIGSAERIPFRDDSFEVVTCLDTLEHLPVELRDAAVEELIRVASAAVFITGPIDSEENRRAENIVLKYIDDINIREHQKYGLIDFERVETTIERILSTRKRGFVSKEFIDNILSWVFFNLGSVRNPNSIYCETLFLREGYYPRRKAVSVYLQESCGEYGKKVA